MYRVKSGFSETSGLPPPIIIKFNKKVDKELVLKNKKGITLDTSLIYPDSEKRYIYINENMTKYYKQLFKKARDLKRKNTVKFAWFKNGKVFIKKTDDSQSIVFDGQYE